MWWSVLLACTPSEGPVGLNELAVDGVEDDRGEAAPWAEVYNSTGSSVSLEGWMLEHQSTPWELEAICHHSSPIATSTILLGATSPRVAAASSIAAACRRESSWAASRP